MSSVLGIHNTLGANKVNKEMNEYYELFGMLRQHFAQDSLLTIS